MTDDQDEDWRGLREHQVFGAAQGRETETAQDRQAQYLRLLDRFSDSIPPHDRLTIKAELAKSLMGEYPRCG